MIMYWVKRKVKLYKIEGVGKKNFIKFKFIAKILKFKFTKLQNIKFLSFKKNGL